MDKGTKVVRYQLNKAFDKQAYRSVTDEDVEEAIRRVRDELGLYESELAAAKILAYSTAKRCSTVGEFFKEFEAQIKDVTQPQGGTENFTNVRSPGTPPAKIPAEPGKSGRNSTGSYRTKDDQEGKYGEGFTYRVSPGSPSGEDGRRNPNYRLNQQRSGQNLEQVGPIGTRGQTSSIPSYGTTKPGAARESYVIEDVDVEIPSPSQPTGGEKIAKSLAARVGLRYRREAGLTTPKPTETTIETVRGQTVTKQTKWATQPFDIFKDEERSKFDANRLPGQPKYPDTENTVTSGPLTKNEQENPQLDEAPSLES